MIGKLADYEIIDSDRAVNVTVQLLADSDRTLIETKQFVVSIDEFKRVIVIGRLTDFVTRKITERSAIPFTKVQLEAELPLGFEVKIPG